VLPRADGQGDGAGADIGLWRALAADLGCASLLVPEDDDGAGASFREAATVAEELGRSVAPVPYLGSAVVATMALLSAGDHRTLPELARGDVTAALAVGFATAPGDPFPRTARLAGPRPGDGGGTARLRGEVRGVADALDADLLLVPADGVPHALYVVGTSAEGVRRTPVSSLDMTRPLCDVEFTDAEAQLIATGSDAEDAFQLALLAGAAALAAEQLGVAEKCLEMTVAYVKERHQFARPISAAKAGTVMVRTRKVSSRIPMPMMTPPWTTVPMLENNKPAIEAAKITPAAVITPPVELSVRMMP